ncbi:phage scaffolding protein [Leuconostoc mesenteroides]|uniref:phage scaffolding protein n=1 Tax=Leuconostoc TaxID=1243 RepID=UPI001CBCB819|nr:MULTISPECIES: phage scaffolding protein [Leuconostoc]MBZ1505965.1 phage scaffolding protein [Leuconostoc mesenteroides]MBZ1540553.1 phage scaffolding protein [Leuconostoc mesenteroides]
MNRDTLQKFGLSDEQVNQVMAEHGKDLEKSKGTESELEQLKQQNTDLTSQIAERDKQLKDLSGKAGNNEELQTQIKALQDQNKQAKTDYEANIATLKRDGAIELALREAKAKNPKAVKALLNGDNITIDDDGVHGLKEQLEQLQESDGYLFTAEQEGAKPGVKITGSGNPSGGSNEVPKLSELSYKQALELKSSNPEVYEQAVAQNKGE